MLGALTTYAANIFFFRDLYHADLTELKLLPKYEQLDLDADMMKEDLKSMGINIKAVHFERE